MTTGLVLLVVGLSLVVLHHTRLSAGQLGTGLAVVGAVLLLVGSS